MAEQRTVISEQGITTENTEKSGGKKIAHVNSAEALEKLQDEAVRQDAAPTKGVEQKPRQYRDRPYYQCPPTDQQGLCFKRSCSRCWADYRNSLGGVNAKS